MIFVVLFYITLTWTDTANNETHFTVERCQVSSIAIECQPYSPLAKLIANSQKYIDASVLPNTMYCYRVNAGNDAGASEWSDISCATAPAAPPIAPTNLLFD